MCHLRDIADPPDRGLAPASSSSSAGSAFSRALSSSTASVSGFLQRMLKTSATQNTLAGWMKQTFCTTDSSIAFSQLSDFSRPHCRLNGAGWRWAARLCESSYRRRKRSSSRHYHKKGYEFVKFPCSSFAECGTDQARCAVIIKALPG